MEKKKRSIQIMESENSPPANRRHNTILKAIKHKKDKYFPTQIVFTKEMRGKICQNLQLKSEELDESLDNHIYMITLNQIISTDKEKGIEYLIPVVKLLPDELSLYIAGSGRYEKRLRKKVEKAGLTGRIKFLGFLGREKLADFYNRCFALILPSVWPEPFGLVGIEAMSYAKPVVAFKAGGIPDWLTDGVNGFLIHRGDVKKMAERINFLYQNKEQAVNIGEQGRSMYYKSFTKEQHLQKLRDIFDGVKNCGYRKTMVFL